MNSCDMTDNMLKGATPHSHVLLALLYMYVPPILEHTSGI